MFPTKYEDSSEEAPHKLIPRHQFSWNLSRILGDLPDFQVKSGTICVFSKRCPAAAITRPGVNTWDVFGIHR